MKISSPLQDMPHSNSAVDHGGFVKPPSNSSSNPFSDILNGAGSGLGSAATGAFSSLPANLAASLGSSGEGGPASGGMVPSSEGSTSLSAPNVSKIPPTGGAAPTLGGASAPGDMQQTLRVVSDLTYALAALTGGANPAGGGTPSPAANGADAAGGTPQGGASAPSKPSADDKRPAGDTRSAEQIIDDNPTLKNLGNQSRVKDNLKKQVGDFEHDPDAAYRASKVLDYVKSSKTSDGGERSGDVKDDGKIDGFTKDGDARHGTEAGLLQDFGKDGYSALKDDHRLDTTKDGHVKKDGTNMDNLTYAGHEITHGISDLAGKFSHALDNLPGPLKALLGPLHMAVSGISGGANVADAAMTGGDVKQAGKDMASGMLTTGSNIAQGIGDLAADTAGKIPGIGKLVSAGAEIGAANISGGLDFANTALQGGDLGQAGKDWGANVAGTAAGTAVGMADPTGIASGAAQSAVTGAIDPTMQEAPAVS